MNIRASSTPELIRHLEQGLSFRTLLAFESHSGIPVTELASIMGIPERTLARRKAGGRLSPDESERLLRVAGIFEKAVELFEGDVPAAVRWLRTPRPVLEKQTPLAYARTEVGAQEVSNLIGRLEHGVFA